MSFNRISNYDDLYGGSENIIVNNMLMVRDLNISMTPAILPGSILLYDGTNFVWTPTASVPGGSVSHIKATINDTLINTEDFKLINITESLPVGAGGVSVVGGSYIQFTEKGVYLVFINYQNKIKGNSLCYEMKTQIKYAADNVNPDVGFDTDIGLCTTPVFRYAGPNIPYFDNASGRDLYNTTTSFSINTNNPGVNTYLRFLCRKISQTYQDGQIMPDTSTISIIRLT